MLPFVAPRVRPVPKAAALVPVNDPSWGAADVEPATGCAFGLLLPLPVLPDDAREPKPLVAPAFNDTDPWVFLGTAPAIPLNLYTNQGIIRKL